ncbi:MAG: ClpXP protease specificity-enhancing factor [Gammaproteobacteria bacterium SHHR-1]|uniref:ClpXP protease specificity-enhancing factor n=1 Tax=Magnetovirga frankeli TaxID=947516 RepID=UPI001293C141|nr:ClpXP protease specificity-enhancing factor [gamma proteobacterium SS-5]
MSSSRPYFIRAIYEWLVDNNMTPHLLVNADARGVEVPVQYVEDGQVVLNIGPGAVKFLQMDNRAITFNARFGGLPTDIRVPPHAVMGIYARENGRGMLFPEDEEFAEDEGPEEPPPPKRPKLRVVK